MNQRLLVDKEVPQTMQKNFRKYLELLEVVEHA